MRRLLAVLMLALSGVVLAQMPAHACTCVTAPRAEQIAAADAIFVGTVMQRGAQGDSLTFEVDVERAFKGAVDDPVIVRTPRGPDACTLSNLEADRRYVFFGAESDGAIDSDSCSGTAPFTPALLASLSEELGPGEVPASEPEAPPAAEIVRTDDATPTSFWRLAAPGAALVLIGLLGIVVLRRATRGH